jgi:long-chain acyl-CoA synthetase
MMSAVPRVIESVYEKIIAKGNQLKGIKRSIFFWSLKIAEKYNIVEWKVQGNIFYKTQLFFARKLVLSKWKAALGGNLEILVSGGAPIQLRLLKIFWAAEIPIYEGYGLTETSPVIAVTNTNKNGIKLGTVGPALPGVTMKIAEDGEVLCKGDTVMKGYYKNPEQTAEVIDKDGWFHTGDIGVIEEAGQLRITDRKKEMFKNSGGKYIAPQMVENKMKESIFISNACVVGDGQKYAAALIVPNFDHLVSWMKIKKINLSDKNEIIADERIIKRIRAEIDKLNTKLGEAEKVKKFELIAEEWTPDTGILSPTLKLKRRIINEKYKEEIEKLF